MLDRPCSSQSSDYQGCLCSKQEFIWLNFCPRVYIASSPNCVQWSYTYSITKSSGLNDHELDFKGAIVTRLRTFLLKNGNSSCEQTTKWFCCASGYELRVCYWSRKRRVLFLDKMSLAAAQHWHLVKPLPWGCQFKVDLYFDCDWLPKARRVVSDRIAASPSVIIEKRAQAFSR